MIGFSQTVKLINEILLSDRHIVFSLFYHFKETPFQVVGPGTISMVCISIAHIVMGSDFSQEVS